MTTVPLCGATAAPLEMLRAALEAGARQKRDFSRNAACRQTGCSSTRRQEKPCPESKVVPRYASRCFNPFKQLSILPSVLPGIDAARIYTKPDSNDLVSVYVSRGEFCFWITSLLDV